MRGTAKMNVPRMTSTTGMKLLPVGATEICQHRNEMTTETIPMPSSQLNHCSRDITTIVNPAAAAMIANR